MTRYDPQAQPELAEVRIGSRAHWRAVGGPATLCGITIAGTPIAPTQRDICQECNALLPCDECGHTGPEHLWAPALEEAHPEASRYVYDHATCWAENVCRLCNPERHAVVLAMLPAPAAPAKEA